MPEPQPEQPDPLAIDRAAIEATIARMSALLEEGKKAIERVEAHYKEHNIYEGIGVQFLTGEDAPEWSQELFTRLLQLSTNPDEIIRALAQNLIEGKAARPAGAKAVSSRYRI
jgi:hypothetical protein